MKFEIGLRMRTNRAHFRGGFAYMYMSAVAAFPDSVAVAGEDESAFDVFYQFAVTLFVPFFYGGYALEHFGDIV